MARTGLRRWLARSAAAAALTVFAAAGVAWLYARRSLPTIDGREQVTGLAAKVEIVRDADAIPHIFASTRRDALFGLGYVHAQDRLWQMEFQRRVGFGRLSEIFGRVTLSQDRFLRTVGFGRAARATWARLPSTAKDDVDAYVRGVNAFIADHHGGQLPPEFAILGFEPEPWTGPDVIVWVKMMAWDLSMNYALELLRDDLVHAVGRDRMQQLIPLYPSDGLSILSTNSTTQNQNASASSVVRLFASMSGLPAVTQLITGNVEGLGSNNWVVDGTKTTTGKPLLANDPHLATHAPSTWYLAHMSAGDFDVIGATLPGTPAVALGRNRSIAWATTNLGADVEDLFREPRDAKTTSVDERIVIKGADPVTIVVRSTAHGPVITDAIDANAEAAPHLDQLALRWTALDEDDTTIAAFLSLNQARNWSDFTTSLRLFVVPPQNFVYADVDGHIGYYAAGRIPIRRIGDGTSPTDDTGEWTGWVPFDALPHVLDPPRHAIVTANNRPSSDDEPFLGVDWQAPYRALRIDALLGRRPMLSPDDFAAMQRDTTSVAAAEISRLLMERTTLRSDEDPLVRQAAALVDGWDGNVAGQSAAAAIYEAWTLALERRLLDRHLPAPLRDTYTSRFTYVFRFMTSQLRSADPFWCGDADSRCSQAVTEALRDAVGELRQRMGNDPQRWQWSAIHDVIFPHEGLDGVRVLRAIVSRRIATAGDWTTIDVGTVAPAQRYEQHAAAGYRQIVDLSPQNDSRFIIDLGESGHPLSPHYSDFLERWRDVQTAPMRMERAAAERGAIGHLTLTPR